MLSQQNAPLKTWTMPLSLSLISIGQDRAGDAFRLSLKTPPSFKGPMSKTPLTRRQNHTIKNSKLQKYLKKYHQKKIQLNKPPRRDPSFQWRSSFTTVAPLQASANLAVSGSKSRSCRGERGDRGERFGLRGLWPRGRSIERSTTFPPGGRLWSNKNPWSWATSFHSEVGRKVRFHLFKMIANQK